MFKAAEECEYLDYDYLSNEEARYQGYDTDDDSDFADGFTVTEFEQKNEPGKDPEKNNNKEENQKSEEEEQESEVDDSPEDDDTWLDGDEDIDENAEPDDEQRPDDPGTDVNDDWYEDDELESDEKASPESYIIDGHEYKDPRKYIQALYQQDVRQYPKLEPEEQIELACAVRWGMLCDCSIMPEDPVVPDEYPYTVAQHSSVIPTVV